MAKHSEIIAEINQILLDPVNPRHDPLQPQVELIKAMIDSQKDKLVRLAEDIVESGLNPSDVITVIPHPTEKEKFFVVEGNRRITALKLLNSPNLCLDAPLRRRFEALSLTHSANPIRTIKCVLYPDRESAEHWITLKHTGENAGVGTVRWDATEIKRFQAQGQNKTESIGLQVMNFILKNIELDDNSKKIIRNMPITTVERLIGDPDIRKSFGLSLVDGLLVSQLTVEATAKALYDFIAPIATGNKKVTDVYYKKDRKKYLEDFGVIPVEASENLSDKTWPLDLPPQPRPLKSNTPAQPKPRSKPLTTARKYVIPSGCGIKITTPRINNIYYELKNQLKVDDVTNACAVLLRVFLEVSIDVYIERKKLTTFFGEELQKKITKITKYMEENKILTRNELKAANKAAGVPHGLFSTNTLNAYVHNPNIHPRADELKLTWDDMELFIKKLWE
jgi:hypothetical protein